MRRIDLEASQRIEIPYITEEEARLLLRKGWSLSSTYFFSELRDVYLALQQKQFVTIGDFSDYCQSINLPFEVTPWNERRLLEHVNALRNFSLLDSDYRPVQQAFVGDIIGTPLSVDDLETFETIYFEYFRFKELFSWFIDLNPQSRLNTVSNLAKADIQDKSHPIFAFSERGRLKDTFLEKLNDATTAYFIRYKDENAEGREETGNEDLMRFWDVFTKWGRALKVLEYFSLRDLDIKTSSNKDILCCYVISQRQPAFNLLDYIKANYEDSYVHLPDLVFKMVTEYRISVSSAHDLILVGYFEHRDYLSLERTSEIFVRQSKILDTETILFPRYNDFFMSHIVVRR